MSATVTTLDVTDADVHVEIEPLPLDGRIASACGHLNAAWARLVELVGEVIATGAWEGIGIRSVEHWLGAWRNR